MSTPLSTPVRQAKLGLVGSKTLPLVSEYKKLLADQHQRIGIKHQQDLDLIDDIRAYTKARLSIERDYATALAKLSKQHSQSIGKKFNLLDQSLADLSSSFGATGSSLSQAGQGTLAGQSGAFEQDGEGKIHKRIGKNSSHLDEPEDASSLYNVWAEHIRRLSATSKNRADQFAQLVIVVDRLKDIRAHKASIGKKSLDNHLKKVQEDLLATIVDLDKAKKLYYEDESQAKRARENEEKIRKKRSGLLNKFTDLQAKKEKTLAQREANDIQSTQARNDYIMALAAANAHIKQYYQRDLNDLIHTIDDGVLDHCKVFMATLGECDINSLKDSLAHAQYWGKMVALTGSQQTNSIFLESQQSTCLRHRGSLQFDACNDDPIRCISLEYNADYALQHEIDKWFTWFKKECRNLSHLTSALDTCQRAAAEGKKSIEITAGTGSEDVESKIIELKQQIRKSESAKLKAQARLKVIKEGGMQIEEWDSVEEEIRADIARAQEAERQARRAKELCGQSQVSDDLCNQLKSSVDIEGHHHHHHHHHQQQHHNDYPSITNNAVEDSQNNDSDDSSISEVQHKSDRQQVNYSSLADPNLAWQDQSILNDPWANDTGTDKISTTNAVALPVTPHVFIKSKSREMADPWLANNDQPSDSTYQLSTNNQGHVSNSSSFLNRVQQQQDQHENQQHDHNITSASGPTITSMTVQSSSPLSAIVDTGNHNNSSTSPYTGLMSEAYKSDYECDYDRNLSQTGNNSAIAGNIGGANNDLRSALSSVDAYNNNSNNNHNSNSNNNQHELEKVINSTLRDKKQDNINDPNSPSTGQDLDLSSIVNKYVIALYPFEGTNEDDLNFQQDDIMQIIEATDYDWYRAVKQSTNEQGFIPSSYVRLINQDEYQLYINNNSIQVIDKNNNVKQVIENDEDEDKSFAREFPKSDLSNNDYRNGDADYDVNDDDDRIDSGKKTSEFGDDPIGELCRALYDYEPENESVEDDGLPHLRLKQGELLKVLDVDENDGWWLVERQSNGEQGHVHSILLEEVEIDDEDSRMAPGDTQADTELDSNSKRKEQTLNSNQIEPRDRKIDQHLNDLDSDEEDDESLKGMPQFSPPPGPPIDLCIDEHHQDNDDVQQDQVQRNDDTNAEQEYDAEINNIVEENDVQDSFMAENIIQENTVEGNIVQENIVEDIVEDIVQESTIEENDVRNFNIESNKEAIPTCITSVHVTEPEDEPPNEDEDHYDIKNC